MSQAVFAPSTLPVRFKPIVLPLRPVGENLVPLLAEAADVLDIDANRAAAGGAPYVVALIGNAAALVRQALDHGSMRPGPAYLDNLAHDELCEIDTELEGTRASVEEGLIDADDGVAFAALAAERIALLLGGRTW